MIGVHAPFELPDDLPLVLLVVRNQAIEDVVVDLAVDIVDIGLLHTVTDIDLLPVEAIDPARMFSFYEAAVVLQGVGKPFEHFVGHRNRSNEVDELLDQLLLTDIRIGALPFEVAAAIVDVLFLLDVTDQQAAAVAALDHPGEQEILLHAPYAWRVPAIENLLNLLP